MFASKPRIQAYLLCYGMKSATSFPFILNKMGCKLRKRMFRLCKVQLKKFKFLLCTHHYYIRCCEAWKEEQDIILILFHWKDTMNKEHYEKSQHIFQLLLFHLKYKGFQRLTLNWVFCLWKLYHFYLLMFPIV